MGNILNWGAIGVIVAILGLLYNFLRNFKTDINKRFDKIDNKLEGMDQRLSRLEGEFSERGKSDQKAMIHEFLQLVKKGEQ